MNDNDYSDFVGFGQSPRYVAMPAWYKDKDEEKKEEEDKVQDPVVEQPVTKVESVVPSVSAPAGNAAGTGAGGADLGKMNNMAVKQSAGGGWTEHIWNMGFDGKPLVNMNTDSDNVQDGDTQFGGAWRGKRSDNGGVDQTGGTGVTDPNAVVSMGSEGGNASGEWKVGQGGSMMPKVVKDPAGMNGGVNGNGTGGGGWMSDYEAYKQGLKDGAAGGGTPADAGETETEGGQGDYPQTWDEFMRKMKEMDENYRKGENRRNWWELMTRGLVGAANLYGTTKGAPALDLSDSKEAFSNKDAYARLKDEKQTMYNVVNKEIERRQKAEAAKMKEKELDARVKKMEGDMKKKQEEWEVKKKKMLADIDKAEQAGETEKWKTMKAEYEAKLKQYESDHEDEKRDLQRRKDEASIAKSEAATWKIYNGGSSSKKSNTGGRIDTNGRSYYFGSGADWCGIADDAGAPKSVCKDPNKAKRWIAKNINNPKVKQYIK